MRYTTDSNLTDSFGHPNAYDTITRAGPARTKRQAVKLFRRNRFLVFGKVDGLPVASLDAFADLRGGLALTGLFVGVESFLDTSAAAGAVLAGEAIKQAAMTLAAVTVAIAGLLIESFLDACGGGVGVPDDGISEEAGAHGRRKRAFGRPRVVSGDGIGAGILWRTRGGALRH